MMKNNKEIAHIGRRKLASFLDVNIYTLSSWEKSLTDRPHWIQMDWQSGKGVAYTMEQLEILHLAKQYETYNRMQLIEVIHKLSKT